MDELEKINRHLAYDPANGVFRWKVPTSKCVKDGQIAGHLDPEGYRVIQIFGKSYRGHRLAWLLTTGTEPPEEIDHMDGNKDNNAFSNLRLANRTQNEQNKRRARKDSDSGLIGAIKNNAIPGRPWIAKIRHNGKRITIGRFKTAEEAHNAYLEAKRRLHEFNTL